MDKKCALSLIPKNPHTHTHDIAWEYPLINLFIIRNCAWVSHSRRFQKFLQSRKICWARKLGKRVVRWLGTRERRKMQKWNDVNTHNEISKLKNCICILSKQHIESMVRGIKERRKEEFRIINNSVYIIEGAKAHIYIVGRVHMRKQIRKINL